MSPGKPTDRVDVMIGFFGAFAALFLVVTVVCEVTGRSALSWALVLLALVVGLGLQLRHRNAIVRRQSLDDGAVGGRRADRP